MALTTATDLDYLIPDLRFHLEMDKSPTEFEDSLLRHALVMACKTLMRKWRNKYTINTSYTVSRNANRSYAEDSPPVIQRSDERVFVLQASIIVKSAELKDTAWNIGSWRDEEISYSNIAGGKYMAESLKDDMRELDDLLHGRLHGSERQSLPGFKLPRNVREGYK